MKNHPIAGGLALIILVGGLGYGVVAAVRGSMRAAETSPSKSKSAPDAEAAEPSFASLGEAIDYGIALARQERMQEALAHFERLTRAYPEAPAAWHNYGLALSAVRMYGPARTALEKALALDPDSWDTTAELATLHVLEKDVSGGLELLESIPAGEGRVGKRLRLDPVWQDLDDPRVAKLLRKHATMEGTSLRGTKALDETRPRPGSAP
jgi:Flp pilus assembly protein TadD